MVQFAVYKGKGLIGNAVIRWWNRSPYSHCELIVDGRWLSSSLMDGGVREKTIVYKPEHWDLITLPEELAPKILAYYELTKGDKYSWLDLIRSQVFNSVADEAGASFCSDWCAAALGIPSPTLYSPATLNDLLLWLYPQNQASK